MSLGVYFVVHMSLGLGYVQNLFDGTCLFSLYTCGIIGTLALLALSKVIENSTILKYYGENTLTMLCLQMQAIQVANMITKIIVQSGYVGFLLTLIIVLLMFLAIIPLVNKYIPWTAGKSSLV